MRLLEAVQAPGNWQAVDFISDLHLQASDPITFDAWRGYLAKASCDALFILGDLFEVWVGDDVLEADTDTSAFARACVQALSVVTKRFPVYFMAGNRDFLVGEKLLCLTGIQALADPTVLTLGHERWMLSHGDALCLADTDYQVFRQEVRTHAWQADFLALPLSQRLTVARQIRQTSEQRKNTLAVWADVDTSAASELLYRHQAKHMIHGHTHRPDTHSLGGAALRYVLSDWDATSQPPRLQVLRWQAGDGLSPGTLKRISLEYATDA